MNSPAHRNPSEHAALSVPQREPATVQDAALQGLTESTIPCAFALLIPPDSCPVDGLAATAPLHPCDVASLRDACAMTNGSCAAEPESGTPLVPPDGDICATRECAIALSSPPPRPATPAMLPSPRAVPARSATLQAVFDLIEEAATEVHAVLGPGLLEAAYAHCLAFELAERGVQAVPHAALPIRYKGQHVTFAARISLIVEQRIAVQIEAAESLQPTHEYRVRRLIDLAGLDGAVVLTFHGASMTSASRRIVRAPSGARARTSHHEVACVW
ncbi:MAG: GxxExxY protein [Polyangiaceae bacterium]|jgi:GxxExxY protein|nr:GxxExxY protein [Polyangiaceae bacterium]